MYALVIAIIYLAPFLVIGLIAKLVIRRWMNKRNLDLTGVRAQMGPSRRPRRIFLLGYWRDEDPD